MTMALSQRTGTRGLCDCDGVSRWSRSSTTTAQVLSAYCSFCLLPYIGPETCKLYSPPCKDTSTVFCRFVGVFSLFTTPDTLKRRSIHRRASLSPVSNNPTTIQYTQYKAGQRFPEEKKVGKLSSEPSSHKVNFGLHSIPILEFIHA